MIQLNHVQDASHVSQTSMECKKDGQNVSMGGSWLCGQLLSSVPDTAEWSTDEPFENGHMGGTMRLHILKNTESTKATQEEESQSWPGIKKTVVHNLDPMLLILNDAMHKGDFFGLTGNLVATLWTDLALVKNLGHFKPASNGSQYVTMGTGPHWHILPKHIVRLFLGNVSERPVWTYTAL